MNDDVTRKHYSAALDRLIGTSLTNDAPFRSWWQRLDDVADNGNWSHRLAAEEDKRPLNDHKVTGERNSSELPSLATFATIAMLACYSWFLYWTWKKNPWREEPAAATFGAYRRFVSPVFSLVAGVTTGLVVLGTTRYDWFVALVLGFMIAFNTLVVGDIFDRTVAKRSSEAKKRTSRSGA
jgi:hypothetical protein